MQNKIFYSIINIAKNKRKEKGDVKNGFLGGSRSNNCSICNNGSILEVKIFVFTFLVYLVNQVVLKKLKIHILSIFFNYYFNDLLAPILLITYSNFLLSFQNKEIKGIGVFIFIGVCAIGWEFITPIFIKTSVSDLWDIVMYLSGASIYIILKKFLKKTY